MPPADSQRRIDELLSEPGGTLGALVSHARRLEALAEGVATLLDPALAGRCRVVDFRGGELALSCDTAAHATELRYHSAPLLERLTRAGIPVTSIKVLVRPAARPPAEPPVRPKRRSLPPEAAKSLDSCASAVNHPPLAEAMRRLARQAVTGDR